MVGEGSLGVKWGRHCGDAGPWGGLIHPSCRGYFLGDGHHGDALAVGDLVGPVDRQHRSAAIKIVFRLPDDLHAELKQWAADEDRSLNRQVVYLLRQAVRERNERKAA